MPIIRVSALDAVHSHHKIIVLLAHTEIIRNSHSSPAGRILSKLDDQRDVRKLGEHVEYEEDGKVYYVLFCRDDQHGWKEMPHHLRSLLAKIRHRAHQIIAVEAMGFSGHPTQDDITALYNMVSVLTNTHHRIELCWMPLGY